MRTSHLLCAVLLGTSLLFASAGRNLLASNKRMASTEDTIETKTKVAAIFSLTSYLINLENCLESEIHAIAQFGLMAGISYEMPDDLKIFVDKVDDATITIADAYVVALKKLSLLQRTTKNLVIDEVHLGTKYLFDEFISESDYVGIDKRIKTDILPDLFDGYVQLKRLKQRVDNFLEKVKIAVSGVVESSTVSFDVQAMDKVLTVSSTCAAIDTFLCADTMFSLFDDGSEDPFAILSLSDHVQGADLAQLADAAIDKPWYGEIVDRVLAKLQKQAPPPANSDAYQTCSMLRAATIVFGQRMFDWIQNGEVPDDGSIEI